MNQNVNKTQKRSHGWGWKIPLGLMVLLLVCLAVTILTINSIALGQINRALTTYLTEGGRVEAIDIGLITGRIELTGVTINPPKSHGTDPLLSLGNLVLDVVPSSLLSDGIVVEELTLKVMSLNLVRDKQSLLDLATLLKAEKPADETKASPGAPSKEKALPVVQVNKIRLEGGSLNYQDSALTGRPMVFQLKDIQLLVDQLRLFDENKGADPAEVSFSFQLKQPGKLPSAQFGTVARMGPVGREIPPVNAHVRLIGLKLDTLGSLVPPATRRALGADGLDSGIAMALNDDRISLEALALTDHNIRYDAIKVQGPLNAPVIEIKPVMAGVFRVTDGVLNIGKSSLGAGISVAESSVDVAKEVGSGTLKVGKKLLGSIFDTGKGLVTLDGKQIEKGVVASTTGTIDLSLDSVKGAGGAAGSGLGQSVSDLTGEAALKAWDKSILTRYQKAMQQAQEALAKMPYPPVTD